MARKVIDEWEFGSVVREGPEEFVNFPGSFAEYVIKETGESANTERTPVTDICPRCRQTIEPAATVVQCPYPTRYFFEHCDVPSWWNEGR